MFEVFCICAANLIRPYTKNTDLTTFPNIIPGEKYKVAETIENSGKEFYKLDGFPDNHVFDKRAFKIVNT